MAEVLLCDGCRAAMVEGHSHAVRVLRAGQAGWKIWEWGHGMMLAHCPECATRQDLREEQARAMDMLARRLVPPADECGLIALED